LIQKREKQEVSVVRPERAKLTPEESLKRVEEFAEKPMEGFVAAVR
jgi:hypothetical protein